MHLVIDPDFAAGSWPGPLRGGEAAAGEEWVGPERLAQVIELLLGLPTPGRTAGERSALLVPTMLATSGFWSESAAVDPFGSARRLLDWRDRLAMASWRGDAREPRLQALAQVTASAAPGLPDRLRAILGALERRGTGIERLTLLAPPDEFEPLWQQLFAALARHGTQLVHAPLAPAPADGDLAHARAPGFAPAGDGSLVLLRPPGALQAAEEVAAWLASLGDDALGHTLVVGAQPVLDAALHRHGLPTLGAGYATADSAMLQLLPLVLDMAWQPQDPQRAFELLSLKPSPVPAEVSWPLREALREWPAIGSDSWNAALEDGLSAILDPERQERTAARMALLWSAPVARGERYSAPVAAARTDMLRTWLAGLMQSPDPPPAAGAALAQCAAFSVVLGGSALGSLTHSQLHRLVDEATRGVVADAPHEALAGLSHVGGPGGVAGAARFVVWWGFHTRAVSRVPRLPLTRAEREDLASRQVALPAVAQLAASQAARWQRPLSQATQALVLVCPRADEGGDELHPHPLWDEVMARIEARGTERRVALARLERESFANSLPRSRREQLRPPAAQRDWRVPAGRIQRRVSESPSSVETLLGCSLKWALDYPGRLQSSDSPFVDDVSDSRLLGRLLHRLLAQLFAAGPAPPQAAAARAGELFDRESSRFAAALWLPGHDSVRAQARRALVRTAESLAEFMHRSGTRVLASEQMRQGHAFETAFAGTPDLLLGSPLRIIDLKWGGARFRRDSLAKGTAIQLASYSYLTREHGAFAPAAYVIMSAQRMFTTDPAQFPNAEPVPGPSPADTWPVVERSHAAEWARVEGGQLQARGVDPDAALERKGSHVADGLLVLEPPCGFCDFAGLCGRAFAKGAR